MMNRTRGAIGSLAWVTMLSVSLMGTPVHSATAQDTSEISTTTSQTQTDAIAAAFSTGKYPYGTKLMLLEGQTGVHNAAGSEAATLTEIEEGDFVTIEAGPEPVGGSDWYKVETDGGITGWIDSRLFGIAQGAPVLDPGTELEVITASLNLRGDPGTSGEIVSGVALGDTVSIIGGPEAVNDLDWYQVETVYGETGWLAAVYLGSSDTTDIPAAGAQTDSESGTTADIAFPEGSWVFVDSDTLNLRADASIDAEIVTELLDGRTGMITGAPIEADDYEWYPVSFGTGDETLTGYVAGSLLAGGITVGSDATVVDGPLNIRTDTSVDAEAITQLETGDTVGIIGGPLMNEDIVWFQIQTNDGTGYVAGRYLGS